MRKNKLIPALLVSALLTTSVAFADTGANSQAAVTPAQKDIKVMMVGRPSVVNSFTDEQKTALLNDFTSMIGKQVESGTITKEAGDALLQQFKMSIGEGNVTISAAIGEAGFLSGEPEDIQKLSPEERKDKLINDMTAINKKEVEAGTITQQEADKRLEELKKQLENWDGNTPIMFSAKATMPGKAISVENIDIEQYKDLTTADKIDKILDNIKDKLGSWDGSSPMMFQIGMPDIKNLPGKIGFTSVFTASASGTANADNMTLEQRKENIINKITETYNGMAKDGALKQEEADKKIAELKEKINNWDGKSPLKIEFISGDNSKNMTIELQE